MHWHMTQGRKDNAPSKNLSRKANQIGFAVYIISILLNVAVEIE